MVKATCWSYLMQALGVDTEEDIYLLAQYLLKKDQTTEMPPAGQDTEAAQELERRESLASQRGKDQEGEKVVKDWSVKDGSIEEEKDVETASQKSFKTGKVTNFGPR